MAKITDKFFNRIIEGKIELSDEEKEALGGKGAYELEASLDVEAGTVECSEEDIKNIIEQKPAVILLKQSENDCTALMLKEATEHESSYIITVFEENVVSSIYVYFEHDDVSVPEEWNAYCDLESTELGTKLYLHVFKKSDDSGELNIIDNRSDDYDADELAGMYLSQIVQGTYYVNASGDEHALLTLNDGGAWYYDVNGGQFTSITINQTQFPIHSVTKL